MSLIEGFGDEVTIFLGILLVLFIICLAWISTNIRDIPFFSVIIIELTHRRNRNTENTNQTEGLSSSEANPPNQSSQNNAENVVEDIIPQSETTSLDNEQSSTIADEVSSVNSQNGEEEETRENPNTDINVTQDTKTDSTDSSQQLDETGLRHRRLNFFQGKNESSTISNPQTVVTDSLNLNQEQGSPVLSPVTEPINRQQESVPLSAENETVHSRETDSETGLITVRLKYLNETQRNVTAAPNVTIGQFRRDHFATELSQNKLVRFIFNGQDLRNDSNTLQNYNIGNNSVVHCLITQVNQQAPPPRQENQGSFDFGVVVLPIFGLLLCFVWYLRFEYRHFFTATSTFMLIGLTFLFIAAVLASWDSQRHRERIPHQHID